MVHQPMSPQEQRQMAWVGSGHAAELDCPVSLGVLDELQGLEARRNENWMPCQQSHEIEMDDGLGEPLRLSAGICHRLTDPQEWMEGGTLSQRQLADALCTGMASPENLPVICSRMGH